MKQTCVQDEPCTRILIESLKLSFNDRKRNVQVDRMVYVLQNSIRDLKPSELATVATKVRA